MLDFLYTCHVDGRLCEIQNLSFWRRWSTNETLGSEEQAASINQTAETWNSCDAEKRTSEN
jgi:hypothetical protein